MLRLDPDEGIAELRREVKELREDKIRAEGFKSGVNSTIRHAFYLCGTFWTLITVGVNVAGEWSYNHIPLVRQIIDIVNGVK